MFDKLRQRLKADKKESRGIYNVSFNEKRAIPIILEPNSLEIFIENTIKEAIIMYMKGFHDIRRDKGIGAEHIKIHLDKGSEGEITIKELLNLGNSIREYLKLFKEPFIDSDKRKIYEWQNNNGIRFRVVSDYLSQEVLDKIKQMGGSQLPLSPFDNTIITFYSDRNLKERVEFKNPKVEEYFNEFGTATEKNISFNESISQKEQINQAQNLTQEILANYKHINKQVQDKFTQIEKQTNKNLASANGIDNTALNSLKAESEKNLSANCNNEFKENKTQRIKR